MPGSRRRAGKPARSAPVKTTAPRGSARTSAIALLGRRDYTAAELRTKLLSNGYTDDDVAATLEGLSQEGLIDDRRLAAAFAQTAIRVKGRGRLRIQHELQARGVDRAIVEAVTSGVVAEDEAEAIEKVLTRKRWPAQPSPIERRRMFEHLLRRGFMPDAVARALRNRRLDVEDGN